MLVYSIVFLLLLFGAFHYDYRKNVFLKKAYYVLVFLVMTAMTALRYRVGGDSLMYEGYFRYLPDLGEFVQFISSNNGLNYQPLFLLFVAACKTVNQDYYFYQVVHAITVNLIIFWFIRRNSAYRYTVLFILYIFLFYFYFTFEIQREILAICCFLLAYNSFQNNRWLKYYIFAVVAFFFHISAFILFLLPLLKLVTFSRKFIILAVIIGFPLIFLKSFLFSIFEIFFITEGMQNKADVYAEVEFSMVGILAFYFVRVIIIFPFMLQIAKSSQNGSWLLAGVLIFSISSQIMVGFDRFLNYLYIPYIIVISEFIHSKTRQLKIASYKKNILLLIIASNLFFVLAYKVAMDLNVRNRARYQSVFFPYESVFEKKKNSEREKFMIELWDRQ